MKTNATTRVDGNIMYTGHKTIKPEKHNSEYDQQALKWLRDTGSTLAITLLGNRKYWPDATDEDLTAPGLKERLEARLPALLEAFQAGVESLGFTF